MEMNIPKKFKVGGVDYEVRLVKHCGTDDDFGLWRPQGIIEIANQAEGHTEALIDRIYVVKLYTEELIKKLKSIEG